MNHVDRSLETLRCFSASERRVNACFSLSSSLSDTEKKKNLWALSLSLVDVHLCLKKHMTGSMFLIILAAF